MTESADTAIRFDPLAPGYADDPYSQYAALRDHDPVHRSELLQGWVVTRFEDVGRLLRDPSVSSDIHHATPNPLTIMELELLSDQPRASRTVVLLDDPDHARIRALMAAPFRAKEIERLRARIVERIDAAFDRLHTERGAGRVELDLVADFAYPLPVEIFSEMLGLPEEDGSQFRYWTQCVARMVDPVMGADERAECTRALDDMHEYLSAEADRKRAHPGDDLMSELVHAEVDGEHLSQEDLVAQLVTLYMAGHEPTAALIAAGTLALLLQTEQLASLRADRSLLRNAVAEFLRFDGPNHFVRRITTRPLRLGDTELPGGSVIYASPASANRDPRRWGDDAHRVRVDRPDAGQHLQFGAGIHACLGSHLARLQAEIAFTAILDRLHDIELVGAPVWGNRMFIRGLTALPIAATISAGRR
ncbi:MAG: cytochrome P450 [Acidimicrobiia bacterium]